jgi:hypothetical protein
LSLNTPGRRPPGGDNIRLLPGPQIKNPFKGIIESNHRIFAPEKYLLVKGSFCQKVLRTYTPDPEAAHQLVDLLRNEKHIRADADTGTPAVADEPEGACE